jgi:hypothetical protein
MSENAKPFCPDCDESAAQPDTLHRRQFIRVLGGTTAAVALAGAAPRLRGDDAKPATKDEKEAKPAEALVRELFGSLSDEQKKAVVLDWDHVARGSRIPTRLRMYNAPIDNKRIGDVYTKPQQELLTRILKAICSDDDGFRRISRNGTWDTSGSLQGCGAHIFGEPDDGKKFAWVFTGHHLTIRCDGNSEEGAAFGGPLYYGHSPNGYSDRNVFNYQTRSVLSVFDALSEKQRKVAVLTGSPGEGAESIKFKKAEQPKPGLSYGEMNKDQQALVEKVMRDLVSPYRKEDADEVMGIIKTNGGLEKIHLAFFQDKQMNDNERWHFWRLEGPGFVWNFRVLPHVHTYVAVSTKT